MWDRGHLATAKGPADLADVLVPGMAAQPRVPKCIGKRLTNRPPSREAQAAQAGDREDLANWTTLCPYHGFHLQSQNKAASKLVGKIYSINKN